MVPCPPISTRTDTPVPYTTPFRSLPVEQARERGRRQEQRHRHLAPEQGGAHVDAVHPGQHARDQVAGVERRAVAPPCHLVVGGAVDLVDPWPPQPPLRQAADTIAILAVGPPHPVPRSSCASRRLALRRGLCR